MAVLIVVAIVATACASSAAENTTTTTTTVASTSPGASVAVLGDPCSPPGSFRETEDGRSAICSRSGESGEALSTPVWRLAAGDVSEGLSSEQGAAVEIVRETYAAHPAGGQWPESDETTLLFVEEMASASRAASDADIDPLTGFNNLVTGYAGANAVSQDESTAAITGLLLGVVTLVGEEDPAGAYATAMLEAGVEEFGG